jgi:lipopolysaccharide export system protein LptC
LLNLSDQQKVDHEVFYVARDIARWSQEHVRRLAEAGRGYGVDLDPEPEDEATLLAKVKQKGSELVGRFHEPSLLLLADLRHIHRTAAGVSLDWEVLAQTAQAMQDTELLALTKDCHPETLRQMRWANAKVKEAAAQVMVTG